MRKRRTRRRRKIMRRTSRKKKKMENTMSLGKDCVPEFIVSVERVIVPEEVDEMVLCKKSRPAMTSLGAVMFILILFCNIVPGGFLHTCGENNKST